MSSNDEITEAETLVKKIIKTNFSKFGIRDKTGRAAFSDVSGKQNWLPKIMLNADLLSLLLFKGRMFEKSWYQIDEKSVSGISVLDLEENSNYDVSHIFNSPVVKLTDTLKYLILRQSICNSIDFDLKRKTVSLDTSINQSLIDHKIINAVNNNERKLDGTLLSLPVPDILLFDEFKAMFKSLSLEEFGINKENSSNNLFDNQFA